MARISYVKKEGAPQEVAEVYSKMEARGAPVANLWKIAAHSSSTLLHFIRMVNALLSKTKRYPKLRELAILRGASIVDCEYERKAHSMFGKELGMTDEQLRAIGDWEHSKAFNETERAVLRFVDEVVKNVKVKDKTFSELARHLD